MDQVKNNLFCLKTVSGIVRSTSFAGETETHSLNTKDEIKNQLKLTSDSQVLLRCCAQGLAARHPMHANISHKIYKDVKTYVQWWPIWTVSSEDNLTGTDSFFFSMVQLYINKTMTSLKANAVVSYPVHVVLMNFTLEFLNFFSFSSSIDSRLQGCLPLIAI